MADEPGSFHRSSVTRRSMTMRRVREEDAERVGDNPHSLLESSRRMAAPAGQSTGETERIEARPRSSVTGRSERRVSGRTVVVQRDAAASHRVTVAARESGRSPSVRVTGGDTIIRYKSGDLVVKRSERRASLRKRAVWTYVGCYVAVFAVYLYCILTGTTTISADEYLGRAFAKRTGEGIVDLERAALEVMRGSRTPAEVRLAQELVFHDADNNTVRLQAGDRLTLLAAAKLGQAIIGDQGREPSKRAFDKPIRIYRETYLTNMDWPFWLALMNAFGFFLLLGLFLWRPGRNYLGTQGKKTAVALREARQALERAEEIQDSFRRLSAEVETRGRDLREAILGRREEDRKSAVAEARRRAKDIAGEVDAVLEREGERVFSELGVDAANEACRRAAAILEQRLGRAEHDFAVEELISSFMGKR